VLAYHSAVFRKSIFSSFLDAGDKQGQAHARGNIMANAYSSLGRYEDAIEGHKFVLEIAQQTGEHLSRYKNAIEYHKKHLEIAQQTGLC
jgi:hypothetical protein